MSDLIQVALFPIPNMVVFPETVVPLHVFEPRYRAMIRHCIKTDMMLAVSHTQKALTPPQGRKKSIPSLQQNQTSYEPCEVFSAGQCHLLKTTADGSLYVEVTMKLRLRKAHTVQQIPFQITACHVLQDEVCENHEQSRQLIDRIHQRLLTISEQHHPQVFEQLNSPEWLQLSAEAYSFQVFRHFRLDPELMQQVLVLTNVNERLKLIWLGLNQVTA
jgi:Lon protease-like protein